MIRYLLSPLLTLVLTLALATPVLADEEKPALKDLGVKPLDKKKKKKFGPGMTSAGTKKKERKSEGQTEESIKASIENQKMILELEPKDGPNYPQMMVALADFYWDLSEHYDRTAHTDELEQAIYDAEERKDQAALAKYKGQQEQLLQQMKYYQDLTVDTYRKVISDFQNAKDLDEIRYFLGYHLTLMGRMEESAEVYTALILNHPQSKYVPDALVNVAEWYFQINDFQNALALYEKAATFVDAPIYGYAIYKQGWCHYNLGNYAVALDKLLKVIKIADEQFAKGIKRAIDLKKEAQNDLVLPYSKVGKPSAAIMFFKKYGGERYLDLCSRLASVYTEQTEYMKSTKLLRNLIKEARKPGPDGEDRVYMTIRFQRQIVDNAHRRADKKDTVAEISEMIRIYEELKGKAPEAFLEKETDGLDDMILQIAAGYQAEYQNTKEQKTLEYTQMLYDEYLRLFRHGKNSYAVSMNNALLMLMTGKYEQAAAEFEKVIAMNPDGKYADEAAERAVIAYLKAMRSVTADVKLKDDKDVLKKKELSTEAQRFTQAVDRWLALVDRQKGTDKKADKERAENLPKALFLTAWTYYEHNHFDAAADRFAKFVRDFPDHEFVEDAARYVLSSYNLAHDVEKLVAYADVLEKNKKLFKGEIAEDVRKIREEVDFLQCFKPEKAGKHLQAAKCFLKYSDDHPDAGKAVHAVFNAAVNYFKAKRVEEAIKTQQRLYSDFKNHELAPKALYAIAEIFRETTVYDEAAKIYEYFYQNHRKHELAEQALKYASIFRKTLGQYDQAVKDLNTYLDDFGKKGETASRVHLDIVLIREKQDRPSWVIRVARSHLRKYKKDKPGIRLQVLGALGKAYKKEDKDRDARETFEATVEYYNSLPDPEKEKLDLAAISAVAEAHFNLGQTVLTKARRIELKGSEKKVQKQITEKLQLVDQTKKTYNAVIQYGHPGWTIAAYTQLGLAYRNLADTVERTEVPRRIRRIPEAAEEYRTIMAEKAQKIRAKAVESYRTALEVARKTHWFNEYSEKAEEAIAQLDLTDASIKEYRLRPVHTGPNRALPEFQQDVQ